MDVPGANSGFLECEEGVKRLWEHSTFFFLDAFLRGSASPIYVLRDLISLFGAGRGVGALLPQVLKSVRHHM